MTEVVVRARTGACPAFISIAGCDVSRLVSNYLLEMNREPGSVAKATFEFAVHGVEVQIDGDVDLVLPEWQQTTPANIELLLLIRDALNAAFPPN